MLTVAKYQKKMTQLDVGSQKRCLPYCSKQRPTHPHHPLIFLHIHYALNGACLGELCALCATKISYFSDL